VTSATVRFRYAERTPAPPLHPWIDSYWWFDVLPGAPAEHVVPPDGCTSLVTSARPGTPPMLLVSGPWLRPLVVAVRPGERYFGLRIRAGAARELLGASPEELRDAVQPAGRWLGPVADQVAAELAGATDADTVAATLDRLFLPRAAELARPDALVLTAADRIAAAAGDLAIDPLARELGVIPVSSTRSWWRWAWSA
jgi:hypothetical protein